MVSKLANLRKCMDTPEIRVQCTYTTAEYLRFYTANHYLSTFLKLIFPQLVPFFGTGTQTTKSEQTYAEMVN